MRAVVYTALSAAAQPLVKVDQPECPEAGVADRRRRDRALQK